MRERWYFPSILLLLQALLPSLLPYYYAAAAGNYIEVIDATGKMKTPGEISQYVGRRIKGLGTKG